MEGARMKLVASMIVRNELGRYLEPCLAHLLAFVDEIRIVDDGSDDGTREWLYDTAPANVSIYSVPTSFFEHEGRARQALLDFTLEADPTHILAIDADEFVADGKKVRAAIAAFPASLAFTLEMCEVWKAWEECLCVRYDGGWAPTRSSALYSVPPPELREGTWAIRDLALSCGREPSTVKRIAQLGKATPTGTEILHFGWTNEADRAARHARYEVADGGRYHRSSHLASIVWPDEKVEMESRDWPPALDQYRPAIVARGGR